VASQINKRDLPWVALIAVSFIFGLAVSWERWGNPLVDCGREMNQPLRLMQGEMLYSDVRHIYGPFSPYFNAGLYRVFGASLGVLYANGILTAALILALTYWIARQLMGRAAATAATLSVMWLCAFKQAGNYILPYSYGALHGSALGLTTLALLLYVIRQRDKRQREDQPHTATDAASTVAPSRRALILLVVAGAFAGLTVLAKTEMGVAAMAAGMTAAALAGYPNLRRAFGLVAIFLLPALVIVIGVYGWLAARVGWHTLADESFLFLRNLPPELVYFNKRVSGLDQPWQSVVQMIGAIVRIGLLAAIIAAISLLFTRRKKERGSEPMRMNDMSVSDAGHISHAQLWMLLGLSVFAFLSLPLAGSIDWDKGPYMAMPVLLLALLLALLARYRKQIQAIGSANAETVALVIVSVYALASLARVILRVRSGGAYSSYLLPASVIMFTYGWAHPFAEMFRDGRARRLARNIAIGLILADALATAGLFAYRFRARNTYTITTARGTIIAVPDLGKAIDEAITFINQETAPGEPIAVMPEGTSLNFFTGRPNPLREEITTPGYLDGADEARAIRQLEQSNTRLVLIANRATSEFGADVFGRDYCQQLMRWVNENFEAVAIFGPDHNPNLQIGDKTFFIRAYRRKDKRSQRVETR